MKTVRLFEWLRPCSPPFLSLGLVLSQQRYVASEMESADKEVAGSDGFESKYLDSLGENL